MNLCDLTCIHIVLRLLVSCTRSLYQLSLVVVSLCICNQYVYACLYIKSDVTRYWTLSTLLDYTAIMFSTIQILWEASLKR